ISPLVRFDGSGGVFALAGLFVLQFIKMAYREAVIGLRARRHFLWRARRGAAEELAEGWQRGQCNDGDGESEANCLHKLSRILKYPMQEERGQKRKRRRFKDHGPTRLGCREPVKRWKRKCLPSYRSSAGIERWPNPIRSSLPARPTASPLSAPNPACKLCACFSPRTPRAWLPAKFRMNSTSPLPPFLTISKNSARSACCASAGREHSSGTRPAPTRFAKCLAFCMTNAARGIAPFPKKPLSTSRKDRSEP